MQHESIMNGIGIMVPEDGLQKKLESGKKLVVKLGFDPTAPDLHLGHAVVLRKLRDFQDAGHDIVVIIGDFTARIGDPTGVNKTRPPLTEAAIKENATTYVSQLARVLDVSKIQVRFNSEWFATLPFDAAIKMLATFTVGQLMQRNDFAQRYAKSEPIALHELVYPVMQGYDSVMIKADVEIGGTDQLFNCMIGKDIQAASGQTSTQVVVCMPILRGLDGVDKMSKSKGNYVALTEAPENMFGKLMSIPDELLEEYIDLATNFPLAEKQTLKAELAGANPMQIKKAVAQNIVAQYHGAAAAEEAAETFARKVQRKEIADTDYEVIDASALGISPGSALVDVIYAIFASKKQPMSKGDIRRVAEGGGITLDGEKVTALNVPLPTGLGEIKLRVGKRNHFRVLLAA